MTAALDLTGLEETLRAIVREELDASVNGKLIRVKEAAGRLSISDRQMRNLLADESIPLTEIRVGDNSVRVSLRQLQRYVEDLEQEAA